MSLGNGNPKDGDKGSNFNYELKVLQGLEAIAVSLENQSKYKSTVLWIFQKFSSAPDVFHVLSNEIGGTWSCTYVSTGEYILENSDVSLSFSNSNTAIFYTGSGSIAGDVTFINNNDNTISINSFNSAGTLANDGIFRGYVEIRKYEV